MTGPIVIVGSGLAGWTAARELRKLDQTVPLALATADGGDFYAKPMLSTALAQKKSAPGLVQTPAADMARRLDVTLHARVTVAGIDRGRKLLRTSAGELAYGRLVLALGADPIRLPLAGDAADAVLSVNDLAAYARFRAALEGAGHVAIMGAGLIGCEFANDLAAAGFAVTVIDPAAYPLSALVPEAAGRSLVAPLEAAGVRWRFGRTVKAVHRSGSGYRLSLDDGSGLEAGLVLSAVGLRPRTALALEAGLAVNRGIVVDEFLATGDPHIFALGDCAEIGGQVRPYVLPIMHAARALAQTLAGRPAPIAFPPMPVTVKTPACPVAVQPVPRDAAGHWQVEVDEHGVRASFLDAAQRLLGFALTGGHAAERNSLAGALSA